MMAIIAAILVALIMLVLGGLMTDVGAWYQGLRKPSWNPPNWLFAPAWTTILGLAAWAGALALTHARTSGAFWSAAGLFGVTILLHLLWSPLFFKMRRPDWALVEIGSLWLSLLVLIIRVEPISALAALLLSPYLLWVTFATGLNWTIVRLNAPFTDGLGAAKSL